MEILEKIRKQLSDFEKKKQALLVELQKEFPTMFKPLFEKSKRIESIGWTQYTPYFNDGDECVFSVNQDDVYINEEYDVEWTDWRVKYFLKGDAEYKDLLEKSPEIDIEEAKIVEDFKSILSSIPDDFYRDMFGDHMKVTMHKDGRIETEEYDHD